MKFRNKNRGLKRMHTGAKKHMNRSRTILMTRASFDTDGQFIGTEQVEAKLQFDPKNKCFYVQIDDDFSHEGGASKSARSDEQLEEVMALLGAQHGGRA